MALRVADQLIEAREIAGAHSALNPSSGPARNASNPACRARLAYGSPVANATVCPAALACTASGTSGSK